MSDSIVKLTQTVQKGGCAAKVAAPILRAALSKVRFPAPHPELLVDAKHFDDAGVYKVSEDLALVQTLDFFTPIVDTPRIFGRVAATNAISDVYAMGGLPKTAMGILAFPLATLDEQVLTEVMNGAAEVVEAARANFIGGHSIDDDTLKFGLSVTGYVHPRQIWTNAGARPGDTLILTKALGTGTLCAGLKRGVYSESDIAEAIQSMTQLNDLILDLSEAERNAIHAATDITGFGLSGHSLQMARASQVTLQIQTKEIPTFQLVYESLKKEHLTKAHRTNREYTQAESDWSAVDPLQALILHDPQTSGGLLLSVDSSMAESLVETISQRFLRAKMIGRVSDPSAKSLRFE